MAIKLENHFCKVFVIDFHQVLATLEHDADEQVEFIKYRTLIKGLDLFLKIEIDQDNVPEAWQKVNLEQAKNVFQTFNDFL